jgi:hypothetical protein
LKEDRAPKCREEKVRSDLLRMGQYVDALRYLNDDGMYSAILAAILQKEKNL